MTDPTAMPHCDRSEIEQAADVTVTRARHMRDWIMAPKLDACRACNGFRIETLGLGELIPALRSTRDGMGSRS
jgi:hypothetical protein